MLASVGMYRSMRSIATAKSRQIPITADAGRRMRGTVNLAQFALGMAFLLLGRCIYLFDRNFVPFLGVSADTYTKVSFDLGVYSGFLPSFIHPLAFSLLCASAVRATGRNAAIICAGWGATHALFEFAQAGASYRWIAPLLDAAGRENVLVRSLENYCLQGVFDVRDLAAVATGCVLAWFLIGALDADGRRKDA